jgi:hypothetical protein
MGRGKQLAASIGVLVLAVAALTACSTPSAPAVTVAGPLPRPDHVMIVVLENEDASAIVGATDAPYLTSLSHAGATFSDAHGETHPSEPNYLALFSGSTQGVTDDRCPVTLSGPNLAAQLQTAGHTFVGYSESLPAAGFTGCNSGDYARKHNPWVNFSDLPASINQPLSAMPADYSKLPTVSIVVPNLCNDMHNCSVATGDSWAKDHLSSYQSWAATHNSLLIVTFDEDSGTSANTIATLLDGPMVAPGDDNQRVDHYSILRTIEDMYALPAIGKAADAAPMRGIWATGTSATQPPASQGP